MLTYRSHWQIWACQDFYFSFPDDQGFPIFGIFSLNWEDMIIHTQTTTLFWEFQSFPESLISQFLSNFCWARRQKIKPDDNEGKLYITLYSHISIATSNLCASRFFVSLLGRSGFFSTVGRLIKQAASPWIFILQTRHRFRPRGRWRCRASLKSGRCRAPKYHPSDGTGLFPYRRAVKIKFNTKPNCIELHIHEAKDPTYRLQYYIYIYIYIYRLIINRLVASRHVLEKNYVYIYIYI